MEKMPFLSEDPVENISAITLS